MEQGSCDEIRKEGIRGAPEVNKYRIQQYVDFIAHVDETYDAGLIDADEWRERVASIIEDIVNEVSQQ